MIVAMAALAIVGPQLTRLPNGIPVVVDATAGPTITIQVLVDVSDLSALEHGAAETMAGALFGETENYSLRELQRLAWSIGGAVVSESAGDCLRLQVTTTRSNLRPAAAFISDALRRPVFSSESLSYARRADLNRQSWFDRTPPLRDVRDALASKGIGPSAVPALTNEQALSLHAKVVRPERVAIGVAGNADSDEVATILGASLGHWRAADASPVRGLMPETRASTGFRTSALTVQGPAVSDEAFAAWITACIALGEGKQSRLNRRFRIPNSAYVLGTYFTFRRAKSFCTFYVSTTTSALVDELQAEAMNFVPTQDEALRAKAYLVGRYRVGGPTDIGRFGAFSIGHETETARAFWLAWWLLRGGAVGKDADFTAEVERLTHSQIVEAAKGWRPD